MKSLKEMLRPAPKAQAKAKPRMSLVQKTERKIHRAVRTVTLVAMVVPIALIAGQRLQHKAVTIKA